MIKNLLILNFMLKVLKRFLNNVLNHLIQIKKLIQKKFKNSNFNKILKIKNIRNIIVLMKNAKGK